MARTPEQTDCEELCKSSSEARVSMADPAPPLPPRASFSSMPAEIKSNIGKLAYEQDRHYRWRMEALAKEKLLACDLLATAPTDERYGRSTTALLLVNQELSELASTLDLEASRCLDDKFTYIVLPRRHVRFRHLILDAKATSPQLERAISLLLLPTFLPIARITIHAAAARKLFGESSGALPVSNTLWTHHRAGSLDAFNLAARTLPDLTLVDVHYSAAPTSAHHKGPLTLGREGEDPDGVFLTTLKKLASLEHLTLDNSDADEAETFYPLPVSWRKNNLPCSSSLKVLVLKNGVEPLDGGDWSFVEQWASSVESLTITMSRFATNNLPSLDHAHFPRLRMLRLTGDFGDSVALLAALDSSPLSSLSLNLASVPSNAKSRLEKLPQLITIPSTTLSLPKSSPPGLVALFKSFCEHHHLMLRYHGRSPLDTTLKSSCDPSFAPRDARREETDQLCDAWDEVLEFGRRSLERVRLDGDLEGAVEMRQRLDELVERMELARD